MSYLPAACFAFFLGSMATLHLARTPTELRAGLLAALACALGTALLTPLFLAAIGTLTVLLALTRARKTLGHKRRTRTLDLFSFKKTPPSPERQRVVEAIKEGLHEATTTAQAQALKTQISLPALRNPLYEQALHVNPFRPDGSKGRVFYDTVPQKTHNLP